MSKNFNSVADIREAWGPEWASASDSEIIAAYAKATGRDPTYVAAVLGAKFDQLGTTTHIQKSFQERATEKAIGGAVLGGSLVLLISVIGLARIISRRAKTALVSAANTSVGAVSSMAANAKFSNVHVDSHDRDKFYETALNELNRRDFDKATQQVAVALGPLGSVHSDQSTMNSPTTPPAQTEEDHWATALAEVEGGQRRPGIWAKAFAEADGDDTKAKAAYIKVRANQLIHEARAESERVRIAEIQSAKDAEHAVEKLAKQNMVDEFLSGADLSVQKVADLVSLANTQIDLVKIADSINGYTLLHWCARHGLDAQAKNLLEMGASASALNAKGKRPDELSRGTALALLLQSAAGLR